MLHKTLNNLYINSNKNSAHIGVYRHIKENKRYETKEISIVYNLVHTAPTLNVSFCQLYLCLYKMLTLRKPGRGYNEKYLWYICSLILTWLLYDKIMLWSLNL